VVVLAAVQDHVGAVLSEPASDVEPEAGIRTGHENTFVREVKD
jgi:hypothetical protein